MAFEWTEIGELIFPSFEVSAKPRDDLRQTGLPKTVSTRIT